MTLTIDDTDAADSTHLMQIGEVARRADVTVRTVRYYEEMGMIEPAMRTEGGFRLYNRSVLRRLQLIASLRALDFPLKDIQELLSIRQDSHIGTVAANKLLRVLRIQLERTTERIRQYEAIRRDIEQAMSLTAECTGCHQELSAEPCKTCGYVREYAKSTETGGPATRHEESLPIAFQAML